MRQKIPQQRCLTPAFPSHEHSRELETCSELLEQKPEILEMVHRDLTHGVKNPELGRKAMTSEQALRCLFLKTLEGYSFPELTFHLVDSTSARAFCRLGFDDNPGCTTLKDNLRKISHKTLEEINCILLELGRENNIEKGRKVRIDTTVVESNIHHPTDSSLLYDCVRAITNTLEGVKEFNIHFSNHQRRAKKRAMEILNSKDSKAQLSPYKDLIKITRKTIGYAEAAISCFTQWARDDAPEKEYLETVAQKLEGLVCCAETVVYQAYRRVVQDETVPADEKLFSIFEPHTDIIVKKRRAIEYGHKACFTFGQSSMVLDCTIEEGNPADSALAIKMIERQENIYGRVPRQVAYDAGFASKSNLSTIKELGVKDVVFHKKRGLVVSDMAKSTWVYKQLKRFRAGAEGCISFLKRCFGLNRCSWRGVDGFKSYVWSSVVSANLLILARHKMKAG